MLPVFALEARKYPGGDDPALVGLAMGIYGLTQAVLQLPLGMASDRFGRKRVIVLGLLVFAGGSLLAALADSVTGLLAGRAMQGLARCRPPSPPCWQTRRATACVPSPWPWWGQHRADVCRGPGGCTPAHGADRPGRPVWADLHAGTGRYCRGAVVGSPETGHAGHGPHAAVWPKCSETPICCA